MINQLAEISKASNRKRNDASEQLEALLSYYKTHPGTMRDGIYRKNGEPVDSGPTESARRYSVQYRFPKMPASTTAATHIT